MFYSQSSKVRGVLDVLKKSRCVKTEKKLSNINLHHIWPQTTWNLSLPWENSHPTHPSSKELKTFLDLFKPTSSTSKFTDLENFPCTLQSHIWHIQVQKSWKVSAVSEKPHLTHPSSEELKTLLAYSNPHLAPQSSQILKTFFALWKSTSNTSKFTVLEKFPCSLQTYI